MNPPAIASLPLNPKPRRGDHASRKLAMGILLQAFRDVISPRESAWKKGEDWNRDAIEWFSSNGLYPGSFRWVCHLLQMSPQNLREWLHKYQTSPKTKRKQMARKFIRFQIPRSM